MERLLIIFLVCIVSVVNAQTKDPRDDGRKIRISVVFTVAYSNGAENIPDSLILKELEDLNLDFNAKNDLSVIDEDFKSLVGNANIEFHLLDTLLQPGGSKGIRRVLKSSNWQNNLINAVSCLNVFIADHGNASDILSDRVNLNFSDVGLHSHVLTHETGHWLGLYHTWGKIGSCSTWGAIFGSHDDEIDDTPRQWKCTDLDYSPICPPTEIPYHKGHKVMYNNFMDYSGCRCMFTIKQTIKMRNNIIQKKTMVFSQSGIGI